MNGVIFSLSWQNIDERILAAQRRVFGHWGVPLIQHRIHGFDHGEWMDWVLGQHATVDLFIFVDADAFPLNALAVREAFDRARSGFLYGNAQASNHIDPSRVYVGPSWCAVSRESWLAGGRPSARADRYHDVGQRWTELLPRFGVKVEMLLPKACVKPLWKLPNGLEFGIGTTFEAGGGAGSAVGAGEAGEKARTFHLFGAGESTYSDPEYSPEARIRILEAAAAGVCVSGAPGPR